MGINGQTKFVKVDMFSVSISIVSVTVVRLMLLHSIIKIEQSKIVQGQTQAEVEAVSKKDSVAKNRIKKNRKFVRCKWIKCTMYSSLINKNIVSISKALWYKRKKTLQDILLSKNFWHHTTLSLMILL